MSLAFFPAFLHKELASPFPRVICVLKDPLPPKETPKYCHTFDSMDHCTEKTASLFRTTIRSPHRRGTEWASWLPTRLGQVAYAASHAPWKPAQSQLHLVDCCWFTSLSLSTLKVLPQHVMDGCPHFKNKKSFKKPSRALVLPRSSMWVHSVNVLPPTENEKKSSSDLLFLNILDQVTNSKSILLWVLNSSSYKQKNYMSKMLNSN